MVGERKPDQMATCPYMVKTFQKSSIEKVDDGRPWYVALGMWGLPSSFK